MEGAVTVSAFGFRLTPPPADATLVIDCRSITNPWRTGASDEELQAEALEHPAAQVFLDLGARHLAEHPDGHVAFGCEFGRHRSVALRDELLRRVKIS